jgi:RND family efflux transporter MFP subunit
MSSRSRRGKVFWLFLALLAVAATVGVVWGLRREAQAGPTDAGETTSVSGVAVTVEPVTARRVQRSVSAVGTLYGRDEIAISPKVEGRVIRVHHDVGDLVKPGEPLLEIDPTDYELAVREAQRALELELARLGLKETPGADFDVGTLPSVVRAAAAERHNMIRIDRIRRIGAGAAAEDRDSAEKDLAMAQAESKQAILDARATVASARQKQAMLDTARQRLADTRIVAPASSAGPAEYVVSQRDVAEGEIVRTLPLGNTVLFRLVVDRPLKLKASVPERHKAEIQAGQDAEVQVEAYPGERFKGKVSRVNPAVDRTSRTFQVEVLLPNDDRRLSAGGFARVAVFTKVDAAARTVPEEALVTFAGVTRLFVVREGKAQAVTVRPGVTLHVPGRTEPRAWVEIDADVPPGTPVVTSGQSQLADGVVVRVR